MMTEPKGTALVLVRTLVATAAMLGSAASAQAADWVRTWQAVPSETVQADTNQAAERLSDVTIRMPIRISAGGKSLRLRLSNELGSEAMTVGTVHVAIAAADGTVQAGTDRTVTFGGKSGATIPAYAPLVSDTVALPVPARAKLLVSIHLPGKVAGATIHALGVATAQFAAGDQTGARSITPVATTTKRYVLSGVDVLGDEATATIAAFGDSITDGANSTDDGDRRWHDLLAARLQRAGGLHFGIANAAISGNRLLATGAGPAALARLDRDVLSLPNIRYLVVLEGVNDIGSATRDKRAIPSADTLIGAYRQIITRAHDKGVRVIGGTILPYKGAGYYGAEADRIRQTVNAWIRTPGNFDGVIDFDRATADKADPLTMAKVYDSGDRLHPGDAGYQAMADAVDLDLFR
jgi:lysophospholipase L1-like esterase